LTVVIPMIVGRAGDGTETIEWVRVVEEVKNPLAATGGTTSSPTPSQPQPPAGQQFLPPVGSGSTGGQPLLPPVGSGPAQQPPLLPGVGAGPSQAAAQATVNVTSAFSIASPQRGLVALRINYPYQAAALSAYYPSTAHPIEANDGGVRVQPRADGFDPGTPVGSGQAVGTYAGPFGLGRQFALGKSVRPFRKALTAQAIYRREVFGSPEVIPN
jgi:hypothetical protein